MGLLASCVLLIATPTGAADPVPAGPAIEVVTGNEYIGYHPRVAADPAGNFMVVWTDQYDYEVEGRRYFATGTSQGPVFVVGDADQDTYTGNFTERGHQAIAADAGGNFVVSYFAYEPAGPSCNERGCLFSKRFDVNGLVGNSFTVRDPTTTYMYADYEEDEAVNPEIAPDGLGNFIIAWEGYDIDPEGVFARRMTGGNQPKGGAFRANETTDGYQAEEGELDVGGDANGNFVIVWEGHSYPTAFGAVAQRFNDKGKPEGPEFMVSSNLDYGNLPQVAMADDGTHMFVWDGSTARVFAGNGTPVTADFTIPNLSNRFNLAAGSSSFVVVWQDYGIDKVVAQRFDLSGTAISTQFDVGAVDGYYPDVAVHDDENFVVTWKTTDALFARQFYVTPPAPQELLLPGTRLLIKNKIPDDPEKNLAKWKGADPALVAPPRGTQSDPRCNGDPAGTVKATIEFASTSSGHGSGVIDLPCENWTATGGSKPNQAVKRGYRYRDSKLEDSSCQTVRIVGTKSLNATCKGKGETTDFPYDLVSGTSEGVVTVVLEMGLFKYCTAFDGATGSDGSDGKKFSVSKAPAPGACPP